MIWLFLINGLIAFCLGWVARNPSVYLINDGSYEKYDYLVLDMDGKEYEVIAK